MTSEEKRKDLALYRLRQAEESLDEAKFLLSGSKSPRSIVNRLYYSMFYATLSMLVFEKYSSSKHTGVISYFNRHFVKTGIFPKELGWVFNRTLELRQRGDYKEYTVITYEQVNPIITAAQDFIVKIKEYLEIRKLI